MAALSPQSFVETLRRVLPAAEGMVALHQPEFAGNEWAYVKDCIDTGWVSSVGAYVDRFEAMLAETCGVAHAVAVVNGTAALHVSLLLAGVRRGDEVLLPALTFIATANAISYLGAIPHFVDVGADRLGLDPAALGAWLEQVAEPGADGPRNRRTGRRIAAIVPMHAFGLPVDMDALVGVAERWGLPIVEDAAESLGSRYKGRPCGSFGLLSAVSFNGNKIVTTGGGGAILTNDAALAKRAKHLTTTAKQPHRWEFVHDEIGFNYRLPNLNAALGCAQLERLDSMVARKRALAERYRAAFAGMTGVRFVTEPADSTSNYWLNAIVAEDDAVRDHLLEAAVAAGFQVRPAWRPMHLLPMYADCPRAPLPVTEALGRQLVNLPSSACLGGEA